MMLRRLIIKWLFGVEFADYKRVVELCKTMVETNDALIKSCEEFRKENERLLEMSKSLIKSSEEMLEYCNEKHNKEKE